MFHFLSSVMAARPQPLTAAASLAEMQAADGAKYFYDKTSGIVSIVLFVRTGRDNTTVLGGHADSKRLANGLRAIRQELSVNSLRRLHPRKHQWADTSR